MCDEDATKPAAFQPCTSSLSLSLSFTLHNLWSAIWMKSGHWNVRRSFWLRGCRRNNKLYHSKVGCEMTTNWVWKNWKQSRHWLPSHVLQGEEKTQEKERERDRRRICIIYPQIILWVIKVRITLFWPKHVRDFSGGKKYLQRYSSNRGEVENWLCWWLRDS